MNDYTEIAVLLDRSGSMQDARADHEGGLNSFVQDQRELAGDVRFTLIQFDSQNPCEVVYDGAPVAEVGRYALIPRGGTPLLDAIGRGVAHVRTRLKDGRKPDQVVVMVITDGQENSSREFTKAQVKALVTEREAEGWKFLFLGANVDAFAEAGALGMASATTLDFANNARGVKAMYAASSSNMLRARRSVQEGASADVVAASYNYTDAQREEAAGIWTTSGTQPQEGTE